MSEVLLGVRFAADPRVLRALRRRVRGALTRRGIGESDIDMVVLVLDELVSNAIEHGNDYRGSEPKPLSARLEVERADLVLVFEDCDMPDDEVESLATALDGGPALPDLDDERGRGLFLVVTGMQAIAVARRDEIGMRLSGRFAGVVPA